METSWRESTTLDVETVNCLVYVTNILLVDPPSRTWTANSHDSATQFTMHGVHLLDPLSGLLLHYTGKTQLSGFDALRPYHMEIGALPAFVMSRVYHIVSDSVV